MSRARIEPASQKLRQKIGGSARTMLAPQAYAAAEAALQAIADQVRPDLLAQINQLEEMSRQRPFNAPTALYAHAQTIRGVAGTCGMPFVGQAAAALCRLLDGVEDGEQIDAGVDHERRRRVPEVVDPEARQLRHPDRPLPAVFDRHERLQGLGVGDQPGTALEPG
jgi:hypothetical protein